MKVEIEEVDTSVLVAEINRRFPGGAIVAAFRNEDGCWASFGGEHKNLVVLGASIMKIIAERVRRAHQDQARMN